MKNKGKDPKGGLGPTSAFAAKQESQDQLLTAPSHTQDMVPRQQMGFIVDDSSWNKNISPTSHSLFTESH